MSVCKQFNFNLHVAAYAVINAKWMGDSEVKAKTIEALLENVGEKSS